MGFFRKHPIKSIQLSLIVPLILVFVATTGFVSYLIIEDSQKAVGKVLDHLRQEIVAVVEQDLESMLLEAIQLNEMHGRAFKNKMMDLTVPMSRERYFVTTLQHFENAAMTYVGLPSGAFYGARRNVDGTYDVVRNNTETGGHSEYYSVDEFGNSHDLIQVYKDFDPRLRPWYQNAETKESVTFSGIYSHFVFKEPTLTASIPYYSGGRLEAVFGVDFLMTWLSETLKELPRGPNGHVFIVDANQQLVATTTNEAIFKVIDGQSKNILASESQDPLTKELMQLDFSKLDSTLPEVTLLGKDYIVGKNPFAYHDIEWEIYTVFLKEDFSAGTQAIIDKSLISMALVTALFVLLTWVVTSRIVKPILSLNNSAKQLKQGIFVEVPTQAGYNEVSELTSNFNDMGRRLVLLLEDLGKQVQMRTIELEYKNKMLNKLSYMDELTQTHNRRKIDEFMDETLTYKKHLNHTMGLLMLDLDFFKLYNDTYGHVEGDHALKAIGAVLKDVVQRKGDLVARYGGEEFLIILLDLPASDVRIVAERIRRQVEALNIPHRESPFGVITVSIGCYHGEVIGDESVEKLIEKADNALYMAKTEGRNRTACFDTYQDPF